MATPPWKLSLQPASYNGVQFHVEVNSRSGGRRVVVHEFPKKDIPYAEDMGRRARRFPVNAYVIGSDYEAIRDELIEQLEAEGNGQLVHPTYQNIDAVVVESYSVTERREQGGYAVLEITFCEAGQDPSTQLSNDTQSTVTSNINSAIGQDTPVSSYGTATDFINSTNTLTGTGGTLGTAQTFIQSSDITGLNPGAGF